ncbi:VpsP family polysaccharide biosynthesis protein [Glaciecola siphonariae]|uniref:VpsP family polysaccharide biosynthesis protein n=1 Tax=Glaciecola siphonariae TaxID=521012 RepID=A0ABV9LZH7_9ALTE
MAINKLNKDEVLTTMKREFSRTRALALFVMLVAIFGFFTSLNFGRATLDYYFVRNAIESWQTDKDAQTEAAFVAAQEAVSQAHSKHESHPLYLDMSGQVSEWGVVAGYATAQSLDDAKAYYLRAAALRPAWPVTWGSLAMIKWRKQEFDEEMMTYLNNADRFGAQKPEIHVLFSELGLALYTANHPFYTGISEQTKQRLVRGLRNPVSRDRVLTSVKLNNAKEFACIWSKSRDTYVHNNILECA